MMSVVSVAAAQRALEATYGLALEGIGEQQVVSALAAAWTGTDPADPRYLERVVDLLPIDESWLFREDALWMWVDDLAGPEMLNGALAAGRPVQILSLGCSAGQEPFSVAILFQQVLGRMGIPPSAASSYVKILGVDSSPARVEAARSGLVPGWSVQRCRSEWLTARVAPEGDASGRYRVNDSVRAMCRFEVGNLLDLAERGNAALGGFDLVVCRHVLIYFRPETAERVAEKLGRGVDPGAILVFSTSEAHLLGTAGAEALDHLGAGRARPVRTSPTARALARGGRRPHRPERSSRRALPPARALEAQTPNGADAVSSHVRGALEHAQAGRAADAFREARAALFHDPKHLYARMLVGMHLVGIDEARGRGVLRELLQATSRMPPEAAVPDAEGLSVGQLAAAVRLLLAREEGR